MDSVRICREGPSRFRWISLQVVEFVMGTPRSLIDSIKFVKGVWGWWLRILMDSVRFYKGGHFEF